MVLAQTNWTNSANRLKIFLDSLDDSQTEENQKGYMTFWISLSIVANTSSAMMKTG